MRVSPRISTGCVRNEARRLCRSGDRTARSRLLCPPAGQDTLCADDALRPDTEIARHVTKHGDGVKCYGALGGRCPSGVARRRPTEARSSIANHPNIATSTGGSYIQHRRLRRYDPHFRRTPALHWAVSARFPRTSRTRSCRAARWPPPHRSHGGKCRLARHGRVGRFLSRVMGFSLYQHFDDKDISTEYSALMSKVMANGNGHVKFPINEPAEGRREIADRRVSGFLPGPGVQHIALATYDISQTVAKMQRAGSRFPEPCRIPTTRNCRIALAKSMSRLKNWRS